MNEPQNEQPMAPQPIPGQPCPTCGERVPIMPRVVREWLTAKRRAKRAARKAQAAAK